MAKPSADRERSYDGDYMKDGKFAENIFVAYCEEQGYECEDLRASKEMRDGEVDFSVWIKGRDNPIPTEIKSDRYIRPSGNVLFEIGRINHTAETSAIWTVGWSIRTLADAIWILNPATGKAYSFRATLLKTTFQEYSRQSRDEMNLRIIPTDKIKTTIAALIPYQRFHGKIKEIDVSHIVTKTYYG